MTNAFDIDSTVARRRIGLARTSRWPRAIGLAAGFVMLGSVLYQRGASPVVWGVSVLYCFGFPHIAWLLARRAADPVRAEQRNLLIDHICGGVAISLMAFNLLPSLLTLFLMGMNSIAAGGRWLLLRGVGCHIVGVGVGLAVFGPQWALASTMLDVIACIPVMLLQPMAVSLGARAAIEKLQSKRTQLEYQSRHDGLSGLFNRSHWESLVHAEFERCRRSHQPATLVMADLDHFKRINDVLGHAAGDDAIRRFSERLRHELRLNDVAGRYGGEEFGLVLPDTSAVAARELIERLRSRLHQQPLLDPVVVTASFGAVEWSADIDSPVAWLRLADQMLYRAKHLGRDRVALLGDALDPAASATAACPPTRTHCIDALGNRAVLSHLLSGFDTSHAALALFDPMDRLMLANAAFRSLYHVPPVECTFPDILRYCHRHHVGPALQCEDIEEWLRMADSKRRSRPHRSFMIDMIDAQLFKADETSFSDGWILLTLQPIAIGPRLPTPTGIATAVAAPETAERP